MINPSFWKARRVFVTGHTGFKGSWLSLWLRELGADVTGYSLPPPTQPSLFEQANVANCTKSILGDLRDYPRLKAALIECRPEVVIHMAAQSVVRRGYDDPIETYSSNVMGTVNLLEALRTSDLNCVVVNVTSDKCYQNNEWIWGYREGDRLGGHDPYSNSKACAELVASAFCDSYFNKPDQAEIRVALASARAGNVIGGGDWTANQLIPDLLRAFLGKTPCLIRSPNAIRPWQFVMEPLRGYLMLAERLASERALTGSGWNFGPDDRDARPVSWIADRLKNLWGNTAAWTSDSASHPREAQLLKLDTSKARGQLRWTPALPLEDALAWIVEWYQVYAAGKDLRPITVQQIHRYQDLCR